MSQTKVHMPMKLSDREKELIKELMMRAKKELKRFNKLMNNN